MGVSTPVSARWMPGGWEASHLHQGGVLPTAPGRRSGVMKDAVSHRDSDGPRPVRPVVVATDGSVDARAALVWAAGWAAEQQLSLRALAAHAVTTAHIPLLPRMAARARHDLDDDLASVCRDRPGLVVDRAVVWDNPASAMVSASRAATAVVLAGPADQPWKQTAMASSSATVAAHARCPVIAVPHGHVDGWKPPRRVVLGLDGSPESAEAGEFAFAQAARWSAPLSAVHALDMPSLMSWSFGPLLGSDQGQLTAELDAALRAAKQRHPTVDACISLVPGAPGAVLRELSEPGSLLVVGSRGLGGFTGLMLGSFSRTALQASRCPIAVVRAGDLDPSTRAAGETP